MARLASGIRKRKDGTYEKRFTVDGKQYSVYSKTLDDLNEKEQAKRKEIKDGMTKKAKEITLDDHFKAWIEEKTLSVKPTTIGTYKTIYRKHIAPVFGSQRLQKIEKHAVRKFMTEIKANYSGRTYNVIRMILNSMFSAAVNDDIIERSPIGGIKSVEVSKKATKTIHRAITQEEQKRLFQELENSYYFNLFCFLLCTGCRIGEAGALTWNDIDYVNGVIHITKTLTMNNGKREIGTSAKTRTSNRDIPINASIREILRRQREQQRMLRIDNIIFSTIYGKYLNAGTANKELRKATDKIGIERITVHALRSLFATRYYENDGEPQMLKMILGHSSYQMTMDLYCQVSQEKVKEQMQKIKII